MKWNIHGESANACVYKISSFRISADCFAVRWSFIESFKILQARESFCHCVVSSVSSNKNNRKWKKMDPPCCSGSTMNPLEVLGRHFFEAEIQLMHTVSHCTEVEAGVNHRLLMLRKCTSVLMSAYSKERVAPFLKSLSGHCSSFFLSPTTSSSSCCQRTNSSRITGLGLGSACRLTVICPAHTHRWADLAIMLAHYIWFIMRAILKRQTCYPFLKPVRAKKKPLEFFFLFSFK